MKKKELETFIRRYTIGGELNKVKWKYSASEKILHTRGAVDNRSFVADVIMNDFDEFGSSDLTICIGDTEKVKGMMSPFEEDINLSINQQGDRILGFTMSDDNCQSYCAAADPASIDPVAKNLQDMPEYHVEVPLTEDFLDKFLKAHGALKEVKDFSVGMNKKEKFEIVFGYSISNSNRIRITPDTDSVKNKLDTALSFPIKNIAAIFKANDDIPDGILSINSHGIARVYFKNDKYICTYYQFANKKA
ncbi:MAG TPA: hypothetical protein PLC59_00040 [Bacteroidales bacterium]|jgi:hypothetical protein|nr:hypothetical protein [Bacteroidales bacterium]